jgi:hypothetical protein
VSNLGTGDDVGFADRLEGVDSVGITLPDKVLVRTSGLDYQQNLLYLHDLAKTTLTNNLQKIKVLDFKRSLSVLHKVDSHSH